MMLAVVFFGTCLILFGLTFVPNRLRKPLVMAVTFLAGLFYALEFFVPTHPSLGKREELTKKYASFSESTGDVKALLVADAQKKNKTLDPKALDVLAELPTADARIALADVLDDSGIEGAVIKASDVEGRIVPENFLTPFFKRVSDWATILQAFALGLGIYSLLTVHLKNIALKRTGWGNSLTLIIAIVAMASTYIAKDYVKTGPVVQFNDVLYNGLMKSLDATMFSIIAFYIVSAAYRAFRIRSVEATILLVAAALVMLGNVPIGQALTNWIPKGPTDVAGNFRIENIAQWILKRASSPATMAIDFGLGVGALATALRLWLSLEKGSYFEEEL
jgi:hypothetical protein